MASLIREKVREFKRDRMASALARANGEQIRQANSTLNWREYWHDQTRLRSRPRLIQVGTNWTCNLRCNFCRLTLDSTQKLFKSLPPRELEISDRVRETVMELMPYPEMMTLTPLGEPLLYSKFGKMLEHHARLGSKNLAMTTNANLINDDRARMIVEGGMAHLFVSVDSSDPETYAGMRVRGDLAKVEEALNHINRWKEKLNSKLPTMTLASTFMERNVRHMADLLEFGIKHKFQTYSIQLMATENKDLANEFLGYHIPLAKECLLQTLKQAEGRDIDVRVNIALRNLLTFSLTPTEWKHVSRVTEGLSGEIEKNDQQDGPTGDKKLDDSIATTGKSLREKCHYPWYFLMIDTDGDCRPCCWTGSTYGNLNKLDFEDIWNGETAMKMRHDFVNNHIPKGCQDKHCRVDLNHTGTKE